MADLYKVLIVDDNPKYLEDVLPYYGYEVACALDGEKAIEILNKDNTIDLVLLDVMMPKLNGWETLKIIRRTPKTKDIPVIMVTAVNEDQKMISGLKTGADDYIIKPFILPNLLARMEAVLRRSKWQSVSVKQSPKKDLPPDLLTSKEKEVLEMVANGASNKQIAEKLFVKEVTVKTHLNSIFKKLKVTNRTQAVLVAGYLHESN